MEKKFLINFGALNVSSFLNKLVGFVFIVLFTHLSTTGDFGVYSLIWAHVAILSAWQDLGTTSVGILQTERNKGSLQSLLILRLLLGLLVSVGTIILAVVLGYPLIVTVCIASFSAIIMSNAVSGFFLIVTSIRQQLAITSVLSVVFNMLTAAVTIAVFMVTKNVYLLMLSTALMFFVYGIVLLVITHFFYIRLTLKFDIPAITALIKRSVVFSLIAFFATLPSKSDFVLLERLGGKENLALYAAAMKFFEAALIILPNYNMASLPILRKTFQESMKKFLGKIRSDIAFVSVISLFIVAVTLLLGGPLITTFLSSKYRSAIPILNILIWALPFLMCTSVFLNALYAMGKERLVVWFFVFQSALHIGVNIALVPAFGYLVPSYLMVFGELSQTVLVGLYLLYSLNHAHHRS